MLRTRASKTTLALVSIGALLFLALHLDFVLWWRSYYSHYPMPGYSSAMASGDVPMFFNSSRRSLLVAEIALAILPLTTLPFASVSVWKAVRALWLGVMLAIAVVWIATPALRHDSDLWPIDLIFLAVMTGTPLACGGLVYAAGAFIKGSLTRDR